MAYVPYTGGELPNLVNVTKRLDPDGSIADIAEILAESNPILKDIPMLEGNLPIGHQTTVRADLPEPTWRRLNYGTRPTKSKTAQITDGMGMLEDWAEVDKDLASLNDNSAEFRLSENTPHLEGMSQKMARTVFYGDPENDADEFLGIGPRYDNFTNAGKPDAVTPSTYLPNVIDNLGTGSALTSIFYVVWGETTVHGIYPKGSQAGLMDEDLGLVTLTDNDGGRFRGYQSHYQWKMGISVRDWRFVSRLCNIDLTELDDPTAQTKLYRNMIKMMHAIPQSGRQRGMFYCGSAISAMLDLAALDKTSAVVGYNKVFGEEILSFRRRPLRECDSILENEAQIV